MTLAADARNLSLSTTASVGLPAGLTVADATRIAEAMSAAHAESTRDVYAHAAARISGDGLCLSDRPC
jgi:hypothetical protein